VPRLRDDAEIAAGLGDDALGSGVTDIAEVADMILRGSGAVYYGIGGRPMAGTARGAVGAAYSSPVVREDNDTQNNRYS
jgi:hypothetical protein